MVDYVLAIMEFMKLVILAFVTLLMSDSFQHPCGVSISDWRLMMMLGRFFRMITL
jgi:hypothetical protein